MAVRVLVSRSVAALLTMAMAVSSGPLPDAQAAPVSPENTQPTAGPETGDGLVRLTRLSAALSWVSPPGTAQVHLQVVPSRNDGPGVDLILGDPLVVAAARYVIAPPQLGQGNYLLLPGMSYDWRVRFSGATHSIGSDDPSWGPWVNGEAFSTPIPSSSVIQPVGPANGAALSDTSPVSLHWNHPDPGLFYFEVQVSGDPNFRTGDNATSFVWWNLVHAGESSPTSSWQTPHLAPRTEYFWRVRPRVQGDGASVAWSQVWRFRTPGAVQPPAPSGLETQEAQMIDMVNGERAAAGLAPLAMDGGLRSVARAHSQDMVNRNYFDHVSPDGMNPFDRMRVAGIPFGYAGENIATSGSVAASHTGLMNSPGHRANILNPNYHKIGIGIVQTARGGVMITQAFTD